METFTKSVSKKFISNRYDNEVQNYLVKDFEKTKKDAQINELMKQIEINQKKIEDRRKQKTEIQEREPEVSDEEIEGELEAFQEKKEKDIELCDEDIENLTLKSAEIQKQIKELKDDEYVKTYKNILQENINYHQNKQIYCQKKASYNVMVRGLEHIEALFPSKFENKAFNLVLQKQGANKVIDFQTNE